MSKTPNWHDLPKSFFTFRGEQAEHVSWRIGFLYPGPNSLAYEGVRDPYYENHELVIEVDAQFYERMRKIGAYYTKLFNDECWALPEPKL